MGIFAKRDLTAGTEITFDYQVSDGKAVPLGSSVDGKVTAVLILFFFFPRHLVGNARRLQAHSLSLRGSKLQWLYWHEGEHTVTLLVRS